jgi:hypothetical protein
MANEQHPALSPERQAFRERFNVRVVTEKEEGSSVRRLPEGVYGFTGAPASDELPLFIKPIFQAFEVLKVAGGEILWVGYITDKEHAAFLAGSEPIFINLYPDPHGEANKLVSIPFSRVDRRKPPTREDGNAMRMEIAPKPEFLGSMSTQN